MKKGLAISLSLLLPAALALSSYIQYGKSARDLEKTILHHGRIVLSSGDLLFPPSDPTRNGASERILDGDFESAAILRFPMPPPEGTYLLTDLALSHWPGKEAGDPPRRRRPVALRIYNGICTTCDPKEFVKYGRIREARIELLQRRANDPDREFLIPEAKVIYRTRIEFPDRPGPVEIPLPLDAFPESPAYPENVTYIIGKIIITSLYPGSRFPDRVAVAEVQYLDREATDGALQKKGAPHIWK